MPTNDHLNFFDITDFTPGLWDERGTQELIAPQNSMSVLQDYMPMKQGGLRAFYRPIAVGSTNVGANEECSGIFARNGAPLRSGAQTDSFDALLVTISDTDKKMRIYRMDGSNLETVWTAIYTDAAGGASAGHQHTDFAFFFDILGGTRYLASIASGPNPGLYAIGYAFGTHGSAVVGGVTDNSVTKLQTFSGPLVVSQARVMVAGGNDSILHYSDVGLVTFTSIPGQQVNVAPNRAEANISIISGIEPSDLLIGKEGAPWVAISGDIASTSTPIREMGDAAHQRQDKQQVPQVPGGIAFIEGGGRVFVTDGRTFNSISDPIKRFALDIDNMVGPGNLAVLNGLLFAPGGYVYDFATGAWFKQSAIASVSHWADPYGGMVWCAGHAPGFDVKKYNLFEGTSNTGMRVSSGTVRTQPFTDQGGRAVEIREVQLYVRAYATSTYVCTLRDRAGNVVATNSLPASVSADERQIKFLFPNVQDEYLSVQVVCSADDGTSEAPTIERLRVGFGPGNMIN